MTPQRVLQVVGAMNRGGAETMLMTLYRALDRDILQFDFLEFGQDESDYTPEIVHLGGRILKAEWSQRPMKLRRTIHRLADAMAQGGPYLAVHSHVLYASGTVLAAARRASIDIRIAHSHATHSVARGPSGLAYHAASLELIRRSATKMAACSWEAGEYLFGPRRFGTRGVVVANAVDTSRFSPVVASERLRLRHALPVPPDWLVLTSVARLEEVKNHLFLVDVASALKDRGVNFTMLFVGDGSLRSRLESLVRERGLENQVLLLGLREDVSDILRCSDAVLMPSLFEGVPVALVEAQATGVQCLVSECVSKEVDLGLDLLRFLPISDAAMWADAIVASRAVPPSPEEVERAMRAKGYSVADALETLLGLYEVQGRREER